MKTLELRPAAVYAVIKVSHWLLLAVVFTVAAQLLLPAFILPGVFCAGTAFYRFLLIRLTCYTLTEEVLRLRSGLLFRRTDHLEWFRVKDLVETQPLLLRPFRLVHLELLSNDRTNPVLWLNAVPSAGLADLIRERVQAARRNNPVFELE